MHNLAIALHLKGYNVTGSDDEIFDPAKSRLEKYGLLPSSIGWNADNITPDIDAVILGMHFFGGIINSLATFLTNNSPICFRPVFLIPTRTKITPTIEKIKGTNQI